MPELDQHYVCWYDKEVAKLKLLYYGYATVCALRSTSTTTIREACVKSSKVLLTELLAIISVFCMGHMQKYTQFFQVLVHYCNS